MAFRTTHQEINDAIIYSSYVLGDETERANRVILDRDEIHLRMDRVIQAQTGFLKVSKPENRPVYDAYVADVRAMLQNGVGFKVEPKIEVKSENENVADAHFMQSNAVCVEEESLSQPASEVESESNVESDGENDADEPNDDVEPSDASETEQPQNNDDERNAESANDYKLE